MGKCKLELGMSVYDSITGIEGTVTAITRYIDGYSNAMVEYTVDGVKFEDWIAVNRLTVNNYA